MLNLITLKKKILKMKNKLTDTFDTNISSPEKVNPFEYPTLKCECGNETFVPAIIFKQVPGILLGNAEEKTVDIPIKVFICSKCGKISPTDEKILKETEEKAAKAVSKSNLIL